MTYSGLEVIANKPPIVATHVGGFNIDNFDTVLRYEKEAATYIRPGQIQQYQQKLLDNILNCKTSIGCLVAPFGYGKTSTAINIWEASKQAGILAIPPFSCNSIAEMGLAIATGIKLALAQTSPKSSEKVQIAYDSYLVSSAKRLAEQDVEQYKIEFDTALRSIQDKIERGYLQVEASGINLLKFLEQLVEIATEVGFQGLLIVVDEFQQFLGTINKAVIANFRTLVWGLKTRPALPLGLLLTMDPDTERNLSERAGDILHRIKEDGLYLNFASVYDREFPRMLWERYSKVFDFQNESPHIVDRATLEAIGQICERPDLSNGPRTVINVFQEIAFTHTSRQKSYSPFDLIDDFLRGSIKFDGDRNKIASLVTELTGYDYIKQVPSRVDTLKLIAAFPRGCPREVAEHYNLVDTFEQLSDELRGEILTQLPEGIALIDLQRVGKPQNKLNIILKKYWMQITEDEIISDRILLLFTRYAIDPLFPPYGNVLSGWRRLEEKFILSPLGGYWQIYEGTFAKEYPLRRICVQICREKNHAIDPIELNQKVHLNLVFVLHQTKTLERSSEPHREQQTFIFHIPTNTPFSLSLPRDIRWIEDYLSPVVMTPGVLLSLVDYIERQLPSIEGMTEAERVRINNTQTKLQTFLATMLLDERLFVGLDSPIIARGAQALQEALFSIFRSYYPTYHTLIALSQWESILESYTDALETLPLLQRRGIENLINTKSVIANRFGYRNHAGFQSQVKQFSHLLSLERWDGDQGEIRFTQHPGEGYLLNIINLNNGLSQPELFNESHFAGYTTRETEFLIKFLIQRGYIQYDPEQDYYQPTITLSYDELDDLSQAIVYEMELMQVVLTNENWLSPIHEEVHHLRNLLQQDEIPYDDIQVRLLQNQRKLHQSREMLGRQIWTNLTAFFERLHSLTDQLEEELPSCKTGLELDAHINGVQRIITEEHKISLKRLSIITARVGDFLKHPIILDDVNLTQLEKIVKTYRELFDQAQENIGIAQELVGRVELYRNWIRLIEQLRRAQDYLGIAKQIIDIVPLEQDLNRIVGQIKSDLSTIGLKSLRDIYEIYAPQVGKLLEEISTAAYLAELSSTNKNDNSASETHPVESTYARYAEIQSGLNGHGQLLQLLERVQNISVSELLTQSQISPEQLIHYLISLEESQKIVTHIRVITPGATND